MPCHSPAYLLVMDFKALQSGKKAVEILPDGSQQAPFQYDFALDGKALEHTVDENGDLWIEGYASDFGLDRQDEAFEPGAFERGLKAFLERNPIMLYHHQYDKALGQFTDARVDDQGLWVRGRVDSPAPGSWAEDVFRKIKRGTIKSFSVGGIFRRRGAKIYEADLGEISVTPFPVNPRTTFAVVAKKAFENVEGKAPEAEEAEVVEEEEAVEVVGPGTETEAEQQAEAVLEEGEEIVPEEEESSEAISADQIPEGSITAAHLAPGIVATEHLSDELRSRVAEFQPEAPSIEEAHQKLGELSAQIGQIFNKLGVKDNNDGQVDTIVPE